jgi:hypothetical protein
MHFRLRSLGFAFSYDPTGTIPKPLKQHPFLKKDHPFRSLRLRLYELEVNAQGFRKKLHEGLVRYNGIFTIRRWEQIK